MTNQKSIAQKLRRLVVEARAAGVVLVADASDMGAIRVMLRRELDSIDDLRIAGESVSVDGACGGGVLPRYDASGNG